MNYKIRVYIDDAGNFLLLKRLVSRDQVYFGRIIHKDFKYVLLSDNYDGSFWTKKPKFLKYIHYAGVL